jgi:glycosyltransferase involved in cell wall biosynthesis
MAQWSKLGSYERIMMNETDMVIAVSDIDANKLKGRHVDPELIPNGIDTTAIPYHDPTESAAGRILFVGSLDYRPNADAVRWFVRRILPAIRSRVPSATLRLVGTGTERIAGEGVDPAGYVADLPAELARADLAVIPMRMGSGVRFKALEAMAAGVPLVTTRLGASGIAVEHERHALIADTPAAFADASVRLLQDRALARTLTQQARRLVEGRYDWSRITPAYLRLLTTARRSKRQSGSAHR